MSSSMPRLQPGHHGHAGAAGVLQLEAGAEAVGPRGADLAVAGSPLDGAARVRLTAASPPPIDMCSCRGRLFVESSCFTSCRRQAPTRRHANPTLVGWLG